MGKNGLIFAAILTLSLTQCGNSRIAYQKTSWPQVGVFSASQPIDLSAPKQLIKIYIPDHKGKPIYKLVCFSGNYDAEQEIGVIYSGGLLCGLNTPNFPDNSTIDNWSLLSSKDITRSAIFSRGNFNAEEITGFCASYPEYGRNRNFRLRGFALNIHLTNVEVKPNYNGYPDDSDTFHNTNFNANRSNYPIGKLVINISIRPDPTSKSSIALLVKIPDPKGDQNVCSQWLENSKAR